MVFCEMCGKAGNLSLAEVEGVDLKLCPNCLKYGKINRSNFSAFSSSSSFPRSNRNFRRENNNSPDLPSFKVVDNFSVLLRKAREKKQLNQEDFAKLLQEKESLISKWESGSFKPGLDLARKIGRILNLDLIEKEDPSENLENHKKADDTLTLGDFIKKRVQ